MQRHYLIPLVLCLAFGCLAADFPTPQEPLFKVIDLNVGESATLTLEKDVLVALELLALREQRDDLRGALRRAEVDLTVNGHPATLVCATYNLPQTIGEVQIDCPVTKGYVQASSLDNMWALDKEVRLRLWPKGSPWIRPRSLIYPVNQRWFASDTQMANDPCYVDAAEVPGRQRVYYHYGLDFGGAEGLVNVRAATDGWVISKGDEVLPGDHPPQVQPRYDVVYLRDERGWYYRYSHLKSIETALRTGQRIRRGTAIGALGKEGGSGGWSHLHFDLSMPQPSGRYGITDAYAFAFQAYLEQYAPSLVAVARPHHVAWSGDSVQLDATRSWHRRRAEELDHFEWRFTDGTTADGAKVLRRYDRPGHYSEVVRVTDASGVEAYDVAVVQVFNREQPELRPPSIHAAYMPTDNLRVGDPVTFKVRTFGIQPDEGVETWSFGDGSPNAVTRSDGNAQVHNPDGYAVIVHRFKQAGTHLVSVSRSNARGEPATARLIVDVTE